MFLFMHSTLLLLHKFFFSVTLPLPVFFVPSSSRLCDQGWSLISAPGRIPPHDWSGTNLQHFAPCFVTSSILRTSIRKAHNQQIHIRHVRKRATIQHSIRRLFGLPATKTSMKRPTMLSPAIANVSPSPSPNVTNLPPTSPTYSSISSEPLVFEPPSPTSRSSSSMFSSSSPCFPDIPPQVSMFPC